MASFAEQIKLHRDQLRVHRSKGRASPPPEMDENDSSFLNNASNRWFGDLSTNTSKRAPVGPVGRQMTRIEIMAQQQARDVIHGGGSSSGGGEVHRGGDGMFNRSQPGKSKPDRRRSPPQLDRTQSVAPAVQPAVQPVRAPGIPVAKARQGGSLAVNHSSSDWAGQSEPQLSAAVRPVLPSRADRAASSNSGAASSNSGAVSSNSVWSLPPTPRQQAARQQAARQQVGGQQTGGQQAGGQSRIKGCATSPCSTARLTVRHRYSFRDGHEARVQTVRLPQACSGLAARYHKEEVS